jgi:proteic killer suppression protein
VPYTLSDDQRVPEQALRRYWTKGDNAGIRPDWRNKVRIVLTRLDAAREPVEMNVPGFGFHALKGDQAGRRCLGVTKLAYHLWVGGEDATDIELEDYHGD